MFLRFKKICAGLTFVALLQNVAFATTVDYKLDENSNVIISGSIDESVANEKIYIQVINQGNNRGNLLDIGDLNTENYKQLINQSVVVKTNAEGKFDYMYKLSDVPSYYKIYASDGSETATKSFYFISPTARQNIIDELKDRSLTKTADELKTKVLETYIDALGLDLTMYNTIKDDAAVVSKLFTYVFNNINQVSDVDTFKKLFYGEILIHKINTLSADDTKTFLAETANRQWVSFDILAAVTYGYLSAETGIPAFWTKISEQTFENGADFAAKAKEILLLTAVNKVAKWNDINPIIEDNKGIITFDYSRYNTSPSRGDIDRAIAGNEYTLIELGQKIDELSYVSSDEPVYSGGGGGGGGNSGVTVSPVIEPEIVPEESVKGFADIENHWAKEYIEKLYKLGVVNGVGVNEFAPNNNVKREEFIKMLAGLFKLDVTENEEYEFSDIPKGHWCYPYVTTARKYGILQGVDGNRFGAGQEITREDMMVLLDRTINILGIDTLIASYEVNFKDYNSIPEYAKDAVTNLTKRGVISGYEDGTFRGKNPATRGETAKILSAFTDYLE